MVLAAIGDTTYNIFLILHILTAMIAFAPAFVHPLLVNQSRALGGARRGLLRFVAMNGQRVYAPALIITGFLGFGLAGLSDEVYRVRQGWLIAAVVIWIAMNGILHALLIPAEKALANGDDSAESRVGVGGAAITLLLVVMLYLMTFKPGL